MLRCHWSSCAWMMARLPLGSWKHAPCALWRRWIMYVYGQCKVACQVSPNLRHGASLKASLCNPKPYFAFVCEPSGGPSLTCLLHIACSWPLVITLVWAPQFFQQHHSSSLSDVALLCLCFRWTYLGYSLTLWLIKSITGAVACKSTLLMAGRMG